MLINAFNTNMVYIEDFLRIIIKVLIILSLLLLLKTKKMKVCIETT